MTENFNYISFGSWEYVEGSVDVVTMGRGRMFEYTPSDTEKRLEGLDSTAIAFLEKLPTFLCSEIKQTSDAVSICVKAKRTNTRIKSQSGAFLLFGHEVALPDAGQDGIEISRVTIQSKAHILEQLDRININATTVYPSIDQTAVHLRDQYQSPQPVRTTSSSAPNDSPEV
ncbi:MULTISPECIES: hypothetical protein [unclassified Mesorhizobium]|uniref:hypothetical protein n=1 Tax=unclassified Mesorhizobium TaxID=325217 RepID=UPI0019D280B6|nr:MULTISPECIES: hypothetical protein [unclassified Mesorhizobium]